MPGYIALREWPDEVNVSMAWVLKPELYARVRTVHWFERAGMLVIAGLDGSVALAPLGRMAPTRRLRWKRWPPQFWSWSEGGRRARGSS